MKRTFLTLLITAILVISAIPVFAVSTGSGVGIDITPEEFPPRIWMCDSRALKEDCVEAGRTSDCPDPLLERIENYAFEGEQLKWQVLVMDKNKIEQVQDVVGTIGPTQGPGNPEQVECQRIAGDPHNGRIPDSCNARIDEQKLTTFDPTTMAYYDCIFTVETPDSMHGEFFITAEARGTDGQSATMDENEFWFLNPTVALTVDGDLTFTNVRPGAESYSKTLLVGNDAEQGSGVLMDMFISGTDFYDPSDSGAKCPTSNRLKLSDDLRSQARLGPDLASGPSFGTPCNADTVGLTSTDNADHICYYAVNGAYTTQGNANADAEGYRPIVYSDEFTRAFYNDAEIIADGPVIIGGAPYYAGNVLTPGAEQSLTFKLALPEPCTGNFNSGQIHFWGEAI